MISNWVWATMEWLWTTILIGMFLGLVALT
jgi:hypothetical protein